MSTQEKEERIVQELLDRLRDVKREHPEPRNSPHEGWAFIAEEYDELKDEVFKKDPNYAQMIDESFDVMVTAFRMIEYCHEKQLSELEKAISNDFKQMEVMESLKVNGKFPNDDLLH